MWNEQDHPRKRAGSAGGHGGEFEDKPSVGDDTDLTDADCPPPHPPDLRDVWEHPERAHAVSIAGDATVGYLAAPDDDWYGYGPIVPEGYRALTVRWEDDGDVILSGEEPTRPGVRLVVDAGFRGRRVPGGEFDVSDRTLADDLAEWDAFMAEDPDEEQRRFDSAWDRAMRGLGRGNA